jgi:hypothetical protein
MKSLNSFSVAVIATVAMCLAQVGYSQTFIHSLTQFPIPLPYTPVFERCISRDHIPQNWNVGQVYQRVHGTNDYVNYAGGNQDIQWETINLYGNVILSGKGTTTALIGSTTRVVIQAPTNQTMHQGTIYHLGAWLDGSWHHGRSHALAPPKFTAIPICVRRIIDPHSPSCLSFGAPLYNSAFGFDFDSANNIYLPAPATVNTDMPGVDIFYITQNNLATRTISASVHKQADSNGNAVFYIDRNFWDPGYFAVHGNCLHPIPHCDKGLSSCNCPCANCGEGCSHCNMYITFIARPTVTARIMRYDVPFAYAETYLVDPSQTHHMSIHNVRADSQGYVTFTPPLDRRKGLTISNGEYITNPFRYAVYVGNQRHVTQNIYYPSTTSQAYSVTVYPKDIPALISPNDWDRYQVGATVPLRWSAAPGASTYILWLKHGNGPWTWYNMGNSGGADLTNPGLGFWQWDVQARTSTGLVVGESVTRNFEIFQPSPSPSSSPWSDSFDMDVLFGEAGNLWYNETVDGDEFVLDELSRSSLTVRDVNGNVQSPMSRSGIGNANIRRVSEASDNLVTEIPENTEPRFELRGRKPLEVISLEPAESDCIWENFLFQILLNPEEIMFYDWWGDAPDSHECDGNCNY